MQKLLSNSFDYEESKAQMHILWALLIVFAFGEFLLNLYLEGQILGIDFIVVQNFVISIKSDISVFIARWIFLILPIFFL